MTESSARPTLSVALCTYNGELYLGTQLDSILQQTRLPDELVVCDDRSTDGTLQLLERFAQQAPFPVRIVTNPSQLGYNKNFEKALSLCTGELIFICDQDDYWLPEKIQLLSDGLLARPELDILFSNAIVADTHLESTGVLFWEVVRFAPDIRARWRNGEAAEVLLDGNRMMGCAAVLRKRLLDTVLPIPTVPGYIYDGWIALVAAMLGTIDFYEKPLLKYRTHEQQQVGIRAQPAGRWVTLVERFTRERPLKLKPFIDKRDQLQVLQKLVNERIPGNTPGKEQLQRRLTYFQTRSSLPLARLRRFGPVLQEWQRGNYKRYSDHTADWYAPYLAALGDILE